MITLVSIYPTLLGTYGDGGNVMALKHRAELQGLDVEVVTVESGEAVPESGDLYVMGGGEDSAQTAASNALRAGAMGITVARVDTGRVVAMAGAVSDCTLDHLARAAVPDANGQTPAVRGNARCAQLPDQRSAWLAQPGKV